MQSRRAPKTLVIHSPHSGKSERLQEGLTYLGQTTQIVSAIPISELDHLPPQGQQWQSDGIEIVIAAGGDGLIGGVITHLAAGDLPLGILPLGTSNDVARSLGIPQELRAAAAVITGGKEIEVDIGRAQPAEQTPHPASKDQRHPAPVFERTQVQGYFAHALTVGLNVQFARIATNIATRQRYGRLTYPFAALEVFRNHTAYDMHIIFDGLAPAPGKAMPGGELQGPVMQVEAQAEMQCRALQATVINAPIFGGQWQIALPHANLHDRRLDIVIIEDVNPDELGNHLAQLFHLQEKAAEDTAPQHQHNPLLRAANLSDIPGIHHFQARGVSVSTTIDPQDVTLDGEVRGQTPIQVRLAEKRLRVLVPQAH